jgi:GTPase SAR1 family protein
MEFNWQFKTVLLGDGAVGKTSIRRNYMKEGFKTTHIPTIGVDFAKKRDYSIHNLGSCRSAQL